MHPGINVFNPGLVDQLHVRITKNGIVFYLNAKDALSGNVFGSLVFAYLQKVLQPGMRLEVLGETSRVAFDVAKFIEEEVLLQLAN